MVNLDGSDPGGIRSGRNQGAKREQRANLCVRVLTNETSRNIISWPMNEFSRNSAKLSYAVGLSDNRGKIYIYINICIDVRALSK